MVRRIAGSFPQSLTRVGRALEGPGSAGGRTGGRDCAAASGCDPSQRLAQMPGIGPMRASAMVATIGEPGTFARVRQLSAWLGIVLRQAFDRRQTGAAGNQETGDTDPCARR